MQRRAFLGGAGAFGAALALPRASLAARAPEIAAELARTPGTPAELATDESFWARVQEAFRVDRSMVNLNNGGVSPAPGIVQDSLARHLANANEAPAYKMWRLQEPNKEGVRQRLARAFGADPEEVAITRNASEALQICQQGFDLEPGDEVLCAWQDYPRMITTWLQRQEREGIRLVRVPIPTPCENPAAVVESYRAALRPNRTRLLLVSHVAFLTGQVLPVREIVALGRAHGIPVIVDGAHAFAHLVFDHAGLDCDYYATSLHKWLSAPFGTGMLYVRRARIPALWPLMAAPAARREDVRKFEEIGTHPVANFLAIADALTFHEGIGPERKLARLVHLRDLWARRLAEHDRVRLHTSLAPGFAGGIACFEVEGVDSAALSRHLWERQRIFQVHVRHEEPPEEGAEPRLAFEGLRISPGVYTTPEEIDRFAGAVEEILAHGLPA